MSAYNSEEFIEEAIESVLNQSFGDFEFLITDDHSDDNTLNIIKSYKDERIILIENSERKGIPINLNNMLKRAKGEYIARIDSDDICLPDRLKMQSEFLDMNPNVGIVGSSAIAFGDKTGEIKVIEDSEKIKCALLFWCPMIHSTAMMKKSMLDKYELSYDERFSKAQDYEFWSRAIRHIEFRNIPIPLIKYRYHETQISNAGVSMQTSYADKVRVNQLEYLGIELSEVEQQIYNRIIMDKSSIAIDEVSLISAVFQKIIESNLSKKYYKQDLLKKYLENFFAGIYLCAEKEAARRCKKEQLWKQNSLIRKIFYTLMRIKNGKNRGSIHENR